MTPSDAEKKPVLILAREAGGIPHALKKGFEACGVAAELCAYDRQIFTDKKNIVNRIIHRLSDPGYLNEIRQLFNQAILSHKELMEAGGFRAVIVMKGHYLDESNRYLLSKMNIPLIVWTYDSLSRAPWQLDVMSLADHTYCLDGGDARGYGGRMEWLPLGYNSELFKKEAGKKDIDIMISGSVSELYTRRKKFIELLGGSAIAKKHHCVFIGTTGFKLSDSFLKLGNLEWVAKGVSPKVLGEYQSRAKICVNIHQDDGLWPINLSFFTIPGSGSCQFAENKEHFKHFLVPGTDYEEFSDDEYLKKLQYLLENDERREKLTENGWLKAESNHTMLERAKMILGRIEKLEVKGRSL